MSNQASLNDQTSNVRISRFLSLSSVIALGSLATTGLGVFLLAGQVLRLIGGQSMLAYGLMAAFFAPVALVLAERAAVTRGAGGAFALTKTSKLVWLQFWTGWLLAGGYFILAAIYSWIAGTVLSNLLLSIFQWEVDSRYLIIAVVVLTGLAKIPDLGPSWRAKTIAIYMTIFFVVGFIIRIWVVPVSGVAFSAFLSTNDALGAIPFLALGLWGLSFILDHRSEIQRPRRNMGPALLLTLLLGGAIGILVSFVLLNLYSGVVTTSIWPLATIGTQVRPITGILLNFSALLIASLGLSQALTSNGRLLTAMNRRGFAPERLVIRNGRVQPYLLILMPVVAALLAILLPIDRLVGTAASTLLLAFGLVTGQTIFQRRSGLPDHRRLRLPLHPLFPVVAALVCFSMAFAQRGQFHIMLAIWVILGIAYYVAYGRQGAVIARQRGLMVAEKDFEKNHSTNNILVLYHKPERAAELLTFAVNLARQRRRRILVLKVIIQTDELLDVAHTPEVDEEWHALKRQIDLSHINNAIEIDPLVRLAPSLTDGIIDTVWDEHVGTLVVDRPADDGDSGITVQEVDNLVRRLPIEILIFNGRIAEPIRRVIVPLTSVGHGQAALRLARDLVRENNGQVDAMGIVHVRASPEAIARARSAIEKIVENLDDRTGISVDVLQIIKYPEDYIKATANYDLALLGSSDEGFLRPTIYSGFPADTVNALEVSGLIVKKRENSVAFWLRQIWETLFRILPKLDRKARSLVYRSMQTNARANVDFYTLIILAAGIAFLGLLLNSSSVIIGAMLIAPLMSPILAMATSIVMGNLNMLRTAGNSTLNGIVMAVGGSALLTLVLFAFGLSLTPTDEILARTSPNLLDLMVALLSGAAAAYAVSRSQLAAALPGVAIAAALVPPLCVVGYGLGTGQVDVALGSALLFLTNLAAIIVAAAVIFLMVGFRPPVRIERGQQAQYGLTLAVLALLTISIVLIFVSIFTARSHRTESTITSMIETAFPSNRAEAYEIQISQEGRIMIAEFILHDYSGSIGENDIAQLQSDISQAVERNVILRTNILSASLVVSDGRQRLPAAGPTSEPTLTPTMEPSVTSSRTPNHTPTPTVTHSPTPLATSTLTATITSAPTETPVIEPTQTSAPTVLPTVTTEATSTVPINPTPTKESTPVLTVESTPESTAAPPPTVSVTPTAIPTTTPSS